VKKTVYAAGAMTAAAAVCYPREATEVSRYTWNVASDFATSTYRDWFDCKFSLSRFCLSLSNSCSRTVQCLE